MQLRKVPKPPEQITSADIYYLFRKYTNEITEVISRVTGRTPEEKTKFERKRIEDKKRIEEKQNQVVVQVSDFEEDATETSED